jgi:hypothetical protein
MAPPDSVSATDAPCYGRKVISLDESWWAIRQLRSDPPGRATSGRRRDQFRSALEQSEQLFRAAAATSLATRPLLAFYGLSQASRAVLAAHRYGERWNPHGHGITAANTSGALEGVTSRDKGSGLFDCLAAAMDSATLPEAVSLGSLVSSLPAFVNPEPFSNIEGPRPLTIVPEHYNSGAVLSMTAVTTGWVHGLPTRVLEAEDLRAAASECLDNYPTLVGWQIAGDPPYFPGHLAGDGVAVKLMWRLAESTSSDAVRSEVVTRNAIQPSRSGGAWIVPVSADGTDRVLAPLVHWWAILHGLSTVVRYEPAVWRKHIDVDSSADAVGLDRLVQVALEDVPFHILQALRQPTAWRPGLT